MEPEIKFDLHIHSKFSKDSLLSPKNILKLSHKYGLNYIAVTDHNTIMGGLECKKIKQNDIGVIAGSEISTDCGDLIGLFLNEEIVSREFGDVIDEVHDQDGIVLYPHPYRRKKFPGTELLKKLDVIEGFNGRTSEELNDMAVDLACNLNKPAISNSDAHFAFEFGKCYTVADEPFIQNDDQARKIITDSKCQMQSCYDSLPLRKFAIASSYFYKKLNNYV